MAKHLITVEVDDETERGLGALGEPSEVLAHLAASTASAVLHPEAPPREQTDASLRTERDLSDAHFAHARAVEEQRADQQVQATRDRADEAAVAGASPALATARAEADVGLARSRAGARRHRAGLVAAEREMTDNDLNGERLLSDATLGDLREANEQAVTTAIHAQERAEEAGAAQARAEGHAHELRVLAEFREMFIAILGHDLRTPLSAISISAGMLLRRGRLDDEDERVVARIISSGQRMGRMITQLLDLTRARLGGGLPLEAVPTDLAELCRTAAQEFEAPVEVVADGDLTGVWDPDRLAEVLSNLTGNALEYATPGTRVRLVAKPDGDQVVVEVENRGPPIPADVLPFIFEPFRRGNPREKSPGGNLGLGLYIARQIMLAHGGTLEARSQGGTTTFVMRLPRFPMRAS